MRMSTHTIMEKGIRIRMIMGMGILWMNMDIHTNILNMPVSPTIILTTFS